MKLDGKPLNLAPVSRTVTAVRQWLETQPDDEVFTTEKMASGAGISPTSITRYRSGLNDVAFVYRAKLYWGNPRAILALKSSVGR